MKNFIVGVLLTLCLCGIVRAHPQYTMTPHIVLEHIQNYGWWAWLDDKQQQLAFCAGTDINTKPVCTPVPDDYIVIEYIAKPKK